LNTRFVSTVGSEGKALLGFSMQEWLSKACMELQIPEPAYRYVDCGAVEGMSYVRWKGSLRTKFFKTPIVLLSGYAPNDDLAREDVALLLLREIVKVSNLAIRDFNYHTVASLEEQLRLLKSENLEIVNENEQLRADLFKTYRRN